MPSTPNAKILEVFRSIQGEGTLMGVSQVFVRFFECNMHCVWCDTPASIGDSTRHYKDVSSEELQRMIMDLYEACHSVSITGGEPLIQIDFLKAFLPQLKAQGVNIYLETNGTLPQELASVIQHVDTIAMDIKLPSSTKQHSFWKEHDEFLRIAIEKNVFLKTVITKDVDEEEVYRAVDMVKHINPNLPFILQPNYFDMKPSDGCVAKCVLLQKYCSKFLTDVRIIPQTHKFMKLR